MATKPSKPQLRMVFRCAPAVTVGALLVADGGKTDSRRGTRRRPSILDHAPVRLVQACCGESTLHHQLDRASTRALANLSADIRRLACPSPRLGNSWNLDRKHVGAYIAMRCGGSTNKDDSAVDDGNRCIDSHNSWIHRSG